jgi:hypothetical protein
MVGVDVGGERRDLVVVGDIERAVLWHLCAQRAGVGHGQLQTVQVAVGQVQFGALRGQPQRGCAANAAGRAGD